MRLKEQKVKSSNKARFVLENNDLPCDAETWKVVNMGDSSGAVFRFSQEDAPNGTEDDYSYMESLLKENCDPEAYEIWVRIHLAMQMGNHSEFKKLVNGIEDLSKIKGPNNTTLLHLTAKNPDAFYSQYLVAPVTTDMSVKEFLNDHLFTTPRKVLSTQEKDSNGYLPIHYAAMMGCWDTLLYLLRADPSTLNVVGFNGATPLITAIQHGQVCSVLTLLDEKPNSSLLDGGYTDLHCALHEGNVYIIMNILKSPIALSSLNVCSEEGGTPLMLACELKSADFVKDLLEKGADANIVRKDGMTAIEIAVRLNAADVLKSLLEKAVPSRRALRASAEKGSVEVMDLLLRKTRDVLNGNNKAGDNLLHIALRHANLPVAFYLTEYSSLTHGENVEKHTPLKVAVLTGAWKVAEALYRKGARINLSELLQVKCNFFVQKCFNSECLSPSQLQRYLGIALREGNELAIAEILIPKGAKLEEFQSANGWGALHYLAKCDGMYLFKLCYVDDPLMPIKEEENKTLAYIAAENSSYRVFYYLLREMKKQKSSLINHYRDRHLLYAVLEAGHFGCFEKMLDTFEGLVDVSLDEDGTRPVHLAAKMASEEILKGLEQKKADFTAKNNLSHTALYYAILAEADNCVSFLLEKKIPVQPEDLYTAVGNDDISHMLMNAKPDQATLDHALYLAVNNCNHEAFLHLRAFGSTLNHVTPDGWTPTLLASRYGQYDILKSILENTPLDRREFNGNNALHIACIEGNYTCGEMLVQSGFSSRELNRSGQNVEQLDKSKILDFHTLKQKMNYPILVELLQQAINCDDKHQRVQEVMKIPRKEKIFMEHEGKTIWGTLLQLLIRISEDKNLIARALEFPEMDTVFQDSEGNTLAHLLVRHDMCLPDRINPLLCHMPNHLGQTPLHLAAAGGKTVVLRYLIGKLPEKMLDTVDRKGRTAVFSSIENEKIECLRMLIQAGANLNCWDHQLITPLILACRKHSLAVIRMLLENGANLNQVGIGKLTPLCLTLGMGESEISRYLIMQGANPNFSFKGACPLHLAALTGDTALIRLLKAKGVSVSQKDENGWGIQHSAAFHGKTDILETFKHLQEGVMDTSLDAPLKLAEKEEATEFLEGATPLHLAAIANKESTVNWLLNQGSDPEVKNERGMDSLFYAAGGKGSGLIKTFASYSFAQEPKSLFSALSRVIAQDNLTGARELYLLGIPPNAYVFDRNTGLHLACQYGALECTCFLLRAKADPFLKNCDQQNAFQIAASNSSSEQFRALLDGSPIDVDTVFGRGEEPLIHVAAMKGNIKHVMLLIARGATLDDTSVRGYTPFHRAVKGGHLELAKLLLFCGADGRRLPRYESFEELTRSLSQDKVLGLQQIMGDFDSLSESAQNESKLHRAVRGRYALGVRMLAQIEEQDQRSISNQTALDVAVETHQKDMIRYLSSLSPRSIT